MATITGDPKEYTERLKAYTQASGIAIEYTDDDSVNGCSKGGLISLNRELPPAEEFNVLVHELAHEKLHRGEHKTTHIVRETEAEAVAYIVSRAIGLDCGIASAEYIHSHDGDAETLTSSLNAVRMAASEIIEAIQPNSDSAASLMRRAA